MSYRSEQCYASSFVTSAVLLIINTLLLDLFSSYFPSKPSLVLRVCMSDLMSDPVYVLVCVVLCVLAEGG